MYNREFGYQEVDGLEGLVIVSAINTSLPMAEIYDGVVFLAPGEFPR